MAQESMTNPRAANEAVQERESEDYSARKTIAIAEHAFYADDILLKGWHYAPADGAEHPGLLLCHGFLSDHREYGWYPKRLAQRGYSVLTYDLRGHGASEGERGVVTPTSVLVDTRAAFHALLRQSATDGDRIAMIGHSLGALITVCALAHEPRLQCGIVMAPPDYLLEELSTTERLLMGVLYHATAAPRLLGLSPRIPNQTSYSDLFEDPQCMARARAIGFLQPKTPFEDYPAALLLRGSECARRVRQPVLVMVGGNDRLVDNRHSWRVYEALAGPKRHIVIEGSGHSIMMDWQRDRAFRHIVNWLKKWDM